MLVTAQTPRPNICCELDFVDSVTHEIDENKCPTKTSGFTVSTTEIYLKKQYKSSIIKNHKITQKKIFDGVPLKSYVASRVIFRFCARYQKKVFFEYQVTNEA